MREIGDEGGRVIDIRPGGPGETPSSASFCSAAPPNWNGPARLTLKPGIEPTLRDLGIHGDITKTMYPAMSRPDHQPDIAGLALDGDQASEPVLGRLVQRGLRDGLRHRPGYHRRRRRADTPSDLPDLEVTGNAQPRAIVKTRAYDDAVGRKSFAQPADVTAMSTKHMFRLPANLMTKLAEHAARKGVTQSLVLEAALATYLSPDGAERLEATLARRLDRLSRQMEWLEQHVGISNEALAIFVRFS